MIKRIFATLAVMVFSVASPVMADKIGYVNAVELVETAPQGKRELKALEDEFKARENALLALRDEAVALEQALTKNSLLLKDSEKTAKTKKLQALQRRLQREQRELSEDFNLRRNEALAKLQKIVTDAVIEVAKAQDYDIIFQQAVWFKPKIDMTQAVLDYLEKADKQ
ncbi:MAG: OmpH family outer membrane protein [Arenicellales bacterium]